jgi:hypothetical protein
MILPLIADLIRIITRQQAELIKFLISHGREDNGTRRAEPEPEPSAPRKSLHRPGSQEWWQEVSRTPPAKDPRDVSMNELARRAANERRSRRLPRSPEQARGWRW